MRMPVQVDIEGKVVKVDTKGENYTVKLGEDFGHLRKHLISSQAEVYKGTDFYPVKITGMYFEIDWEGGIPWLQLFVELRNERKKKLPPEFYLRFYLFEEEDREHLGEVFEITV